MLRRLALAAIRLYQRHISPRKGFCCAYRMYTGHPGCSELGLRAIRRHGVLHGGFILRRRLWLCGVVYRRQSAPPARPRFARGQAGFCDVGGCDLPGCDVPSIELPSVDLPDVFSKLGDALDTASLCADCGDCGGSDWWKHKREDEQTVYIPPHVNGHDTRRNAQGVQT